MKKFGKIALVATIALCAGLATVEGASADTYWQACHPGREQLNDRLTYQNMRIRDEYRDGEIGWRRAQYLHREDRFIRGRERFDSRFHDSHLSPAQYRTLNYEENGVNRQIGW